MKDAKEFAEQVFNLLNRQPKTTAKALDVVVSYMSYFKESIPSHQLIAKQIGCDNRKTGQRKMGWLKDHNILTWDHRYIDNEQTTNRYRLNPLLLTREACSILSKICPSFNKLITVFLLLSSMGNACLKGNVPQIKNYKLITYKQEIYMISEKDEWTACNWCEQWKNRCTCSEFIDCAEENEIWEEISASPRGCPSEPRSADLHTGSPYEGERPSTVDPRELLHITKQDPDFLFMEKELNTFLKGEGCEVFPNHPESLSNREDCEATRNEAFPSEGPTSGPLTERSWHIGAPKDSPLESQEIYLSIYSDTDDGDWYEL